MSLWYIWVYSGYPNIPNTKYKIQKYMYTCNLKHKEKNYNTLYYTQYNIFHVEKQYIQHIQDFPRYTYNFLNETVTWCTFITRPIFRRNYDRSDAV